MNSIDIFILALLIIGFIIGIFRGLIRELISILIIVCAIYCTKWLTPIAKSILTDTFSVSEKLAQPFSYIIIFLVIIIGFNLIAKSLTALADAASLGGLNRIMGGVFGAVKTAIILSLLFNILASSIFFRDLITKESINSSKYYSYILPLTPYLWDKTTENDKTVNNEQAQD